MQHIKYYATLLLLGAVSALWAQPKIQLDQYATGFNRPVDIAHCGDSRLFVVEQRGYIWILDSLGNRLATPFLNIDPLVNSNGNEQGLLGLAFHPNYAQNGWFYVNYIKNNGDTRIARFSVSADPNVADPASERVLLEVDQPYSNHNGGCTKFGADGMLYVSLGDGGSGGDPQNFSQRKDTYLGKMLRFNVNTDVAPYYTVPTDNPFLSDPAYFPEVWSTGLRNVWRFSFDRLNGDMWMGEVGQNEREEINYEPANTGGRNYGWRCYEGNLPYNTNGCQSQSSYTGPVFDYSHAAANGCSVTGGFVYRGTKYPDMYGHYLFADYCSGRWWHTRPNGSGGYTTSVLANLTTYEYSSMGEDRDGELYVATLSTGRIMKVREICSALQLSATVDNSTCPGSLDGAVTITTTGAVGTPAFTWSNGASGPSLAGLGIGTYTVTATTVNQCSRTATVTVLSDVAVFTPTITSNSTILCGPQSVVLSTDSQFPSGSTYQWYLDGQALQGINQPTLNVSSSGSYTLTVMNSNCILGTSTPIVVSELSAPVVGVVGGEAPVICPDDSIALEASAAPAGFGYLWSNGATTQTITVQDNNNQINYFATYTGPNGCQSGGSNELTVSNFAVIAISIGYLDDTLLYEIPNLPSYQWSLNGQPIPGANTNKYKPIVTGLYSLTITTIEGCTFTLSYNVTALNATTPTDLVDFNVTPNLTTGFTKANINVRTSQALQLDIMDVQGRTISSEKLRGSILAHDLDLTNLASGTYFVALKWDHHIVLRSVVKQ
jgi:glucose/arabinose dehydrogenase